MQKECLSCLKQFNVIRAHGGHNRSFCYTCFPSDLNKSERATLRYNLLRMRAYNDKVALGCSQCGYKKFGGALEWHHHNDDKSFEPSDLIKRSWIAYQEEISKCVLLCANCHREVHAGL